MFIILLAFLSFAAEAKTIIAHRGLSGLAPESSEQAYILARELGADFLEGDIHQTKDKVLVIFHDSLLDRVTNIDDVYPERKDEPIENFTFAELEKLTLGKNQKIISLDQLIAIAGNKSGLYLEIKQPGTEEAIASYFQNKKTERPLIFQSFFPDSLRKLKALLPNSTRVLLFHRDKHTTVDEQLDLATEVAQGVGPDFTMLLGDYSFGILGKDFVKRAKARNLFVHPFTINTKLHQHLTRRLDVDGYFTNRADTALVMDKRLTNGERKKIIERVLGKK